MLTTVLAPKRFGRIAYDEGRVEAFYEKSALVEAWMSGDVFVLPAHLLDYITGDETS